MTDAIRIAHNRRLRDRDRLVAEATALPEPSDGEAVLSVPGGIGLAAVHHVDLDSATATWTAAEEHRLRAMVTGPAAMDDLLGRWDERVRSLATPGLDDSEMAIAWPSRDAEMVPVFRRHGLSPKGAAAVRRAGWETPSSSSRVRVRPVEPSDVPGAVELRRQLLRWDNQFFGYPERSAVLSRTWDSVADASHDTLWVWVVEDDGEIVGIVTVQPPRQSTWIQPLVSVEPVAYLPVMSVAEDRRGTGVGAALIRAAHDALDAAGVPVTMLHYHTLNPLSAPFWHRCGYRPLWTTWVRQPAAGR